MNPSKANTISTRTQNSRTETSKKNIKARQVESDQGKFRGLNFLARPLQVCWRKKEMCRRSKFEEIEIPNCQEESCHENGAARKGDVRRKNCQEKGVDNRWKWQELSVRKKGRGKQRSKQRGANTKRCQEKDKSLERDDRRKRHREKEMSGDTNDTRKNCPEKEEINIINTKQGWKEKPMSREKDVRDGRSEKGRQETEWPLERCRRESCLEKMVKRGICLPRAQESSRINSMEKTWKNKGKCKDKEISNQCTTFRSSTSMFAGRLTRSSICFTYRTPTTVRKHLFFSINSVFALGFLRS